MQGHLLVTARLRTTARWIAAAAIAVLAGALPAHAFDQQHAAWTALLARHVHDLPDGHASRVDYAGMARDRAELQAVLSAYGTVTHAQFDTWTRAEREAFLIDAYNAFTIEKVLTRYPGLRSIRDFGMLFGNPWKDRFFMLLGDRASLDDIEHGMLRKGYEEPRIHVALVCAAAGCPMLRSEAYVADRLDAQLEDQMRRFLSDRSRNRYDPAAGRLEVSRIFEWYEADFGHGWHGYDSVPGMLARYADLLADAPADRERIRERQAPVAFLDYDWALNDLTR